MLGSKTVKTIIKYVTQSSQGQFTPAPLSQPTMRLNVWAVLFLKDNYF